MLFKFVSIKLASFRGSKPELKLEHSGAPYSQEVTSGQGLTSKSDSSSLDVRAGAPFAQELSARGAPSVVAAWHSGVEYVASGFQSICRRMDKYGILRQLGQGASGRVLLADDLGNGGRVAIKVVKRARPGEEYLQHKIVDELGILRYLGSTDLGPTLVTELKESFVDAHNYYFVMSYCPGGDLLSVMRQHGGVLPEGLVRMYAGELLTGLLFLHAHGIIHRDLKPENLLIRDGHLVISDFGLAHTLANGVPKTYAGTPGYISPEMYRCQPYKHEVDLWAAGCIIFEMLFGYLPFDPDNHFETMYGDLAFPESRYIANDLKHLLYWLLQKDPSKRLTIGEALQHPYFAGLDMNAVLWRNYTVPGTVEARQEVLPSAYIPAKLLVNPDHVHDDWLTTRPMDVIFFSLPLEQGDVPCLPSCAFGHGLTPSVSKPLPSITIPALERTSWEANSETPVWISPATTAAGSWHGVDDKWLEPRRDFFE